MFLSKGDGMNGSYVQYPPSVYYVNGNFVTMMSTPNGPQIAPLPPSQQPQNLMPPPPPGGFYLNQAQQNFPN